MVTSYILVLTFSAWLAGFGLSYVGGRVTSLLSLPFAPIQPIIAAVAGIAFLMVAAAPGWVLVVALALLAIPTTRLTTLFPAQFQWAAIPALLLPLIATPLLGAPSWVALDSALIASSMLGSVQARGVSGPIGRALWPYAWLIAWLAFSALRALADGAVHAS